MFTWGIEEPETLSAINKVGFQGKILNLAAGDGRFNNELLELANRVIAVDIDPNELAKLKSNCNSNFKNKLSTQTLDITKKLPFVDKTIDGVFCTGTLHLFNVETIKMILEEIKRVLKIDGKIVIDFATDIIRLAKDGQKVIYDNNYTLEDATNLFKNEFKDYSISIEISTFEEKDLEDGAGYKSIKGNFLIISAIKTK